MTRAKCFSSSASSTASTASIFSGASPSSRRRGTAIFAVLALIALLGGLATSLVFTAMNEYGHGARMRDSLALSNLTEGGLDRAKAQLRASNAYRGESKVALGRGEVSIRVEPDGKRCRIEVTAAVPDFEDARHTMKVEETWGKTVGSRQ